MTNDYGTIVIQYGAQQTPKGWLPVLVLRGRERVQWHPRGFDRDTALAMAEAEAQDEASHYVGDWDVRVTAV